MVGGSVCGVNDEEQKRYNEVILNSKWELNSDSIYNNGKIKKIDQVLKVKLKMVVKKNTKHPKI